MPLRNSNLFEHVGVGITEDVNLLTTHRYIYIYHERIFIHDFFSMTY